LLSFFVAVYTTHFIYSQRPTLFLLDKCSFVLFGHAKICMYMCVTFVFKLNLTTLAIIHVLSIYNTNVGSNPVLKRRFTEIYTDWRPKTSEKKLFRHM
jgi:hypothetical protein